MTFWHTIISKLLHAEEISFDEYIAITDGYGNEFYDGNPIYNFKVDKLNKGVRIIQEEPEESSYQLLAWVQDTELSNEAKIDELVINLELTTETTFLVVDLINAWILNDFTKHRMQRYIEVLLNVKTEVTGMQKTEI